MQKNCAEDIAFAFGPLKDLEALSFWPVFAQFSWSQPKKTGRKLRSDQFLELPYLFSRL